MQGPLLSVLIVWIEYVSVDMAIPSSHQHIQSYFLHIQSYLSQINVHFPLTYCFLQVNPHQVKKSYRTGYTPDDIAKAYAAV